MKERAMYVLAILVVFFAVIANGGVVYQESFNGAAGDYFVSFQPDITTDAKKWGGTVNYVYTGIGTTTSTVNNTRSSFLDFIPESGRKYTLSISLRMNPQESGQTIPFAVGFISTNNASSTMNWFQNADSPWIRVASTGLGAMADKATVSGAGYLAATNVNTYTIELDTTGDQWVASYTVNGYGIGSTATYTYTVNPSIEGVGFGMSGGSGINMTAEIASFELSEFVPSETVFRERFEGSAGSGFISSEPDVTTGATTWSGSVNYVFTEEGSTTSTVNNARSCFLDFVPQSGEKYTFSAFLRMNPQESGQTIPFAIGFISADKASSTMNWFQNTDSPWIRILSDGGLGAMVGSAQQSGTSYSSVTNFCLYTIELDTTGDQWVASYKVNGFNIGPAATYTYSINPDIVGVGFGMSGNSGVNMTAEVALFELGALSMYSDPSYSGWIAGYSVGIATGMTDDADGDGLSNLAEFGFGGDPSDVSNVGYQPSFTIISDSGTSLLEYVYARRTDAEAHGLTYSLEQTTNLVSGVWSTNLGVVVVETGDLEAGVFESVTNRITLGSEPQQFLRARIGSE
ncbi:hypothetical protein [Tichowtungia aerotolerans]|uniref:CBM-cenC domain-containing protein n=1 Tax=Tichowtungia aerotolerans TaxID=2697043 RepID=A0A6P1M9G6_9BACT|nr:hypothetical protein [Tichowtungia aerotolerans]QHI68718.1 hypothetical protein GT409_04400 [Tichowtungia aerotolerans]